MNTAQSINQSVDTMVACKESHKQPRHGLWYLWNKRSFVNTTNLINHLRLNHDTEYKALMMLMTEKESLVSSGAARTRKMFLAESFGTGSCRHSPGAEEM